jgi:hypothetical protein
MWILMTRNRNCQVQQILTLLRGATNCAGAAVNFPQLRQSTHAQTMRGTASSLPGRFASTPLVNGSVNGRRCLLQTCEPLVCFDRSVDHYVQVNRALARNDCLGATWRTTCMQLRLHVFQAAPARDYRPGLFIPQFSSFLQFLSQRSLQWSSSSPLPSASPY